MIIVEGMDNTGKSTLVQSLAEEFKLCKVSTYHKPKSSRMVWDYNNWLRQAPQPLIMDRHPAISDLIYGLKLRGHSYITEEQSRAWAEDHCIIYCRPSVEFIFRTFDERDQMEGVKDNILALLTFYDAFMETIPHFVYTHTNLEDLKNVIREYLQGSN